MDTYRVAVAPLLDDHGASIEVSDTFALDALEIGTERFESNGPVSFEVTITHAGTGIVAFGSVSWPVRATCARCLCDFTTSIEADLDGFYVQPGQEEGVPEEQEIEYIDAEESIDLMPVIMASLVLEAPFAPLHDEECAGMCAECGADLNEGPCDCATHADDDHPFAALRSLLGNEDASGEPGGQSDPQG